MFWKIIKYDDVFLESLGYDADGKQTLVPKISDLSVWRLQYFIKNLVNSENPLDKWNHTTCDLYKDFHLFGLNDDGLGNKQLEIVIQVDFENKMLRFSMIEEIEKDDNQ